jgi:cell division protein FtsB
LTYQLLTENGRQELAEKWKNNKLKYIEEMKNKNLEDEKVKREERIKRLEQELNLLKNID